MLTEVPTVAMNDFARRHTPSSGHSHYDGSFEALCGLVALAMTEEENIHVEVDDEDGKVLKVTVDPSGFFSPIVIAESGMEFTGKFAPRDRTEGEHPFIQIRARGGCKLPATSVGIILYSKSKLAVRGENSSDADWEVVSINAQRDDSDEPPTPTTILRNARGYPGGTPTEYTLDQILDSIEYWIGGGPSSPHVKLDG